MLCYIVIVMLYCYVILLLLCYIDIELFYQLKPYYVKILIATLILWILSTFMVILYLPSN